MNKRQKKKFESKHAMKKYVKHIEIKLSLTNGKRILVNIRHGKISDIKMFTDNGNLKSVRLNIPDNTVNNVICTAYILFKFKLIDFEKTKYSFREVIPIERTDDNYE